MVRGTRLYVNVEVFEDKYCSFEECEILNIMDQYWTGINSFRVEIKINSGQQMIFFIRIAFKTKLKA